jgi:hypothetical protein
MKTGLLVPCKPCEDIYGYDENIPSGNLYFLFSAAIDDGSIGINSNAPIRRGGGIFNQWQFNPGGYISAAVHELDQHPC